MALSLAFHVVFAVFGVGLPWLLLFAERRYLVAGDGVWYVLARRWSRAFAVIFAVGVFGISFTLEAFAFFLEAIFLGLYLYGWERLPARAHWWTGVPVAVSGVASALFVTTANAWMNTPVGFTESGGVVVAAHPWAPFLAPATPHQVVHMLLGAFLCTGFGVASVYAVALLRGRRDSYHRRGFAVGLTMGAF